MLLEEEDDVVFPERIGVMKGEDNLLHRSVLAKKAPPHPIDGSQHRFIGDPCQTQSRGRFFPALGQLRHRFNITEKIVPQRPHRVIYRATDIRDGNHRHELGKVRVAGAPDEQPIALAAPLPVPQSQPRTGTVTVAKRSELTAGGLAHRLFRATLTNDVNLSQIAGGPALLHPELTGTASRFTAGCR